MSNLLIKKRFIKLKLILIQKIDKMKIVSFLLILLCIFGINECQPIADSKTGNINFFFEMLNPTFRHHRARIRPYLNQLGSPLVNIRGTR
jgi:hypothetical protein